MNANRAEKLFTTQNRINTMADKNNSRTENIRNERMMPYHFYLQSDEEDDFGGFLPVETTLEELYPPVCHSCNEDECWLFGYLILLLLFSCGAIGLGVFVFVWEIIQDTNERFFLELLAPILALILAIVAGVLWLVSIVGCVGTVKQSTKLLRIITIVFKVLLLLEIALSSLAFYYQTRVKDETNKLAEWMSFIQHYHEDPNLRFTLDSIQTRLRCCGFNGYEDWKENSLFSCSSLHSKTCLLPVTCCNEAERQKRDCEYKIRRSNSSSSETLRQPQKFVHTKGCLTIIQDWYKYNLLLISVSCILLAVVQVIVIFAIKRLLRRITNENVEECSVATEQELIPLQEDVQDETSPTEVHEEIRARNTSVMVQRIHTLKVVLRAVVGWSGMHSTKEENI